MPHTAADAMVDKREKRSLGKNRVLLNITAVFIYLDHKERLFFAPLRLCAKKMWSIYLKMA